MGLATIGLALILAGCQGPNAPKDPPAAGQSASATCAGFGIPVGSKTYNECVAYQDPRPPGQSVPPYQLDLYNNRVDAEGYRVDGTGHRMAVEPPY
jgi:hypothetical protein